MNLLRKTNSQARNNNTSHVFLSARRIVCAEIVFFKGESHYCWLKEGKGSNAMVFVWTGRSHGVICALRGMFFAAFRESFDTITSVASRLPGADG
jgi:hypothetical protein